MSTRRPRCDGQSGSALGLVMCTDVLERTGAFIIAGQIYPVMIQHIPPKRRDPFARLHVLSHPTRIVTSQKTAIATLDGSFKHLCITHYRNRTNLRLTEPKVHAHAMKAYGGNGGVAPRSLNIRSGGSWAK
jgi:hypothetical protein